MKIHLQIIVVGVALLGLAGCDQSAKQPPASTEAVKESAAADAIKEDAGDIAGRIAEPLTDLRASADYRALVAANLLRKFFMQVEGQL